MKTEHNNEQLILKAAEEEFLEKGFEGAKTTAIAKKAGVTHAMLHYYFRTKENLFQKVFQEKVQMVADSFEVIFEDNISFKDVIRRVVEHHFDFISENPHLLNFVFNEALANKNNRAPVADILFPKVIKILEQIQKIINEEVAKGTINPIKPVDLMMNIVALNLVGFMVYPVINEYEADKDSKYFKEALKERKESNVQFILNALSI